VLKGHGTENDFVVLPDLDGAVALTPELVRALCDRHAGIGADGVLRVVRCENEPEAKDMAPDAPYFMDYRNADGSIAQMCGNGIRVVMRYLQGANLVELDAAVATRGGVKRVRASGDGDVTVEMGQPLILADRPVVTAAQHRPVAAGASVLMPNPHVVVWVEDLDALAALDLSVPPTVQPPMSDGQNVEFAVRLGPRHLVMRVHERGVGETRSCGTGICAVAVAAARADGSGADGSGADGSGADGSGADGEPWRVDVPGGTCTVTWRADGEVLLTGPAVILAEIELSDSWLDSVLG
jgi:diaminopimelate epimerase